MSILLSDEITDVRSAHVEAAIHAVQYLEEPCTEHPYWRNLHENLYEKYRYLCPDCMKQVHEELGI
jgi:hypothetical protein